MNMIKIAVTITTILVLISLFSTLMERMIQQFLSVQIFLLQLSVYYHEININVVGNIFVTKYSGLQSKIYFVTKYSGLQAKNWAGELISGQTRAGKILVKYTILDLLHTRKIGDEMRK